MPAELKELTPKVLKLSPADRARLAHVLIASLDDVVDEDAEEAWDKEIKRRMKEIRSGKAKGRPAGEVLSEIRAKLR